MLGNRPLTTVRCLPSTGECQCLNAPESPEFVQMLLNLTLLAPCSCILHEVENQFFQSQCRLAFKKGRPEAGPIRRDSSEAEHVAVSGDLMPQPCRIQMSCKF